MFAENCCAELTTKSITRALVNQSWNIRDIDKTYT